MNIKYETYFDKVYGAWYGKCLGGAGGAPVEGIKEIIKVEDFLEIINPLLPNDDLDLQLLWLEVLENNGEKLMATDLAKAWIEKCWYPFSEYGYFMKNYKRGISPPYSGRFNNSFFKEGMGCPIRSEIWGLIYPGQAEKAAYFAKMDGELDHTDNSVWAEMFLAGVESMMFEDSNIQRLILKGLKLIPKDTKLYNCINMCMDLYNKGKKDWKYARNLVVQKFGHPDFTNVVQNLGFIIIALLFGECDMRKTINIALKCGYDTDCTCATAGAIIGGIIGYKNIDSALLNSVQDSYVIGIDVKRRSCSIRDLAEDTCRVGVALLKDKSESILILDAPEYNFNWNKKEENLSILVDYTDVPAIGFNDICDIKITIKNNSDYDFSGILSIKNIPNGWTANINKLNINIKKNSEFVLENLEFSTDGVFKLLNTNIMQIEVSEKNGNDVYIRDFGIAGAVSYKAYGP
ncbi:MAG: ADP-ribosylglycohydrolase family protein, partial [Oscillospiraceae bacterium]